MAVSTVYVARAKLVYLHRYRRYKANILVAIYPRRSRLLRNSIFEFVQVSQSIELPLLEPEIRMLGSA
jgi:hypothetical protein